MQLRVSFVAFSQLPEETLAQMTSSRAVVPEQAGQPGDSRMVRMVRGTGEEEGGSRVCQLCSISSHAHPLAHHIPEVSLALSTTHSHTPYYFTLLIVSLPQTTLR